MKFPEDSKDTDNFFPRGYTKNFCCEEFLKRVENGIEVSKKLFLKNDCFGLYKTFQWMID